MFPFSQACVFFFGASPQRKSFRSFLLATEELSSSGVSSTQQSNRHRGRSHTTKILRHERSMGGLNNASQLLSRPSGEVLPPGLLVPKLAEHSGPRGKERGRGKLGRESGSSVAEDP